MPAPVAPEPSAKVSGGRAQPRPADSRQGVASPVSADLRAYYADVEAGLLSRGLLRTDGGGPDTPYDARRLTETFLRVAFTQEFDGTSGRLVRRDREGRLSRWSDDVAIGLVFGDSVSGTRRAADIAEVRDYAARLARAARHPVALTEAPGNFTVLVLNEDERRAAGPLLRRIVSGISDATVQAVIDLPRSEYCLVFGFDTQGNETYGRAVALLRAEQPDLLHLTCLHEEIAQGLGLPGDSPFARPSIFNDDEEFGLLTTHDEALLRILYDPRLRPGMTAEDARPIVARIAEELLGASS